MSTDIFDDILFGCADIVSMFSMCWPPGGITMSS